MSSIAIPKLKLADILDKIKERYLLVAPVRNQDILDFAVVKEAQTVELSNDITYKSPKEYLFPQVEKILCFTSDGGLTPGDKASPTVLFGIKPCDLAAIKIMTAVFTTGKYADTGFENRLEKTILVGLGCLEEKPACFCREREVDRTASKDCDVFLTDRGLYYAAEIFSEKGHELLADLDLEVIRDGAAEQAAEPAAQQDLLEINAAENDLFTKIDWERLTEKCLGCGICTYICPTCHCFEFKDVEEKGTVTRYKCWDSCMYPRFTLHASGHNPRESKQDRYRQRVLHKYLYVKQNFGYTACTGCARCIRSCPAGMNINTIAKEINTILEVKGEN